MNKKEEKERTKRKITVVGRKDQFQPDLVLHVRAPGPPQLTETAPTCSDVRAPFVSGTRACPCSLRTD